MHLVLQFPLDQASRNVAPSDSRENLRRRELFGSVSIRQKRLQHFDSIKGISRSEPASEDEKLHHEVENVEQFDGGVSVGEEVSVLAADREHDATRETPGDSVEPRRPIFFLKLQVPEIQVQLQGHHLTDGILDFQLKSIKLDNVRQFFPYRMRKLSFFLEKYSFFLPMTCQYVWPVGRQWTSTHSGR